MTDAQLEAAARRFCKLEGLDPQGKGYLGDWCSEAWMYHARKLRNLYHAILAIEQAMEEDRSPENTDKT